MKIIYEGRMFETSEVIAEGLFTQSKPGYSKKPTLGRSAVFFYVEDSKEPGYVQPDMSNPILTDFIQFCPTLDFAMKLKEKYIKMNGLGADHPVHVIKRTKEIVG